MGVMCETEDLIGLSLFQDHRAAFKSKTTWEVIRAYLIFQICGIDAIVDNNEKVRRLSQNIYIVKDLEYPGRHNIYVRCQLETPEFCLDIGIWKLQFYNSLEHTFAKSTHKYQQSQH